MNGMSFPSSGRVRVRISFIGKPREICVWGRWWNLTIRWICGDEMFVRMLEIKCVYKFFRKKGTLPAFGCLSPHFKTDSNCWLELDKATWISRWEAADADKKVSIYRNLKLAGCSTATTKRGMIKSFVIEFFQGFRFHSTFHIIN